MEQKGNCDEQQESFKLPSSTNKKLYKQSENKKNYGEK